MNQHNRNANLDGNDIDMDWSTGKTEPELKTHQILVTSLPFHLAPRPVHHVEVVQVVGLLAPRPRNTGVSPVETQWSPPVGWQRPPVRPPDMV